MKKIMMIVALIVIAVATQAQGFRITVTPTPTAFDLTVGVDQNDSIIHINLSGSESNVEYQLFVMDGKYDVNKESQARTKPDYAGEKKDFRPIGAPIKGTGKPITFSLPKDHLNITCMVKASNACGDFEMKNMITSDDVRKVCEVLRASKSEVSLSNSEGEWSIIALFALVIVVVFYGIRNRKKLVVGDHREIKAPFTGTIHRKK